MTVLALLVGLGAGWGLGRWAAARRERRLAKLLSFVAHEINSPLASLKLTSTGFLQDLYGPVSDQHRPWLSMIREQTARCEALVGDLRDFLHLELHKDAALHKEETDFRELVADAVEAMSTAFGRADAPLEADLPASLPPMQADPDRLRRVVLAMLAHAKKFRAAGPVAVALKPRPGAVELSVSFKSLSIPDDARGRMLDLWQPADARDGRGTACVGFGLGFADALARLHGGRLSFELGADAACRVALTLPDGGDA